MLKPLSFFVGMLAVSAGTFAQENELLQDIPGDNESPVKYAIYSSAWTENSNAGLRVVAQNLGQDTVKLVSLLFRDEQDPNTQILVELDMSIPANGWAEQQLPYIDLLFGNECIRKTQNDDWKLVEISNYTLNPSVRGLIIEDTTSFRIFQCIRPVYVVWAEDNQAFQESQWVMYHYERQTLNN
ncbi:MAG: hypothetical protein RQ757_02695 [Pseudomonadales bacterium]|nr:hypothetical protein [Pseudomonadales bacterium]